MKAGDLVTLSAYANGLDSLYKWCERARQRMHKCHAHGRIDCQSVPLALA